jgi:serine/threonine protein kinase/tetratricopeptide (TPR) repeat protein
MNCPNCHSENPKGAFYCAKCAAPLQTPESPPHPPTRTLQTTNPNLPIGGTFAGRYQVIEELGKGGMGRVYKVFDTEIQEKVALKLLNPEIAGDEKTIERFRNELKTARKISHKNVCRMYHLSKFEDAQYITMEYVSGEDLKSMIHMMGSLSGGQAITIAKQICEGLGEAHRLGVIHRDLKPQNIMIDRDGNARIMDFGIARSLKARGITDAGVIIGTPEYMSPEQVDGRETDQRSDIYSLGVILFEMLTGRLPFEGETPFSVAFKHKSEAAPDPRKINSQIPEELSRVVLRCLEKDKDKRYQRAEEVLSELVKIEKAIPTSEKALPKIKPSTSREITVHFGLRNVIIPGLVFLGLLVIGLVIWRVKAPRGAVPVFPGKPSVAILYFENISEDKSLDPWKTGLPELLTTGLAQSKFVNVLSGDRVYGILKALGLDKARKYSTEDLVKVANEGRVNQTVGGSIMRAGGNIIITLRLQNPRSGEVISSIKVECKGEAEIIPKADELIRKIKSDLNLTTEQLASDIDKGVGKITTSSPEAFKYYSEGRKLHNEQEYRQSINTMEKAVAIDPDFAMAYRSMAMSLSNMQYYSESKKYLQKALELSDRISERERYLIQGDYYRDTAGTYDKSIEAYDKLLQLYPDDTIALTNLAIIYSNMEEWDKTIALYEGQIKNKDDGIFPYMNLYEPYMAKGMSDKAREVLETYVRDFKDNYAIRIYLSLVYFVQGKLDLALDSANRAIALSPSARENFMALGDIYRSQGDFDPAEKEYKKLFNLDEKVAHFNGLDNLAALYLHEGRFAEAQHQLEKGVQLARNLGDAGWESDFHLRLAQLAQRSGSLARALEESGKALKSAQEIKDPWRQVTALTSLGIVQSSLNALPEAQKALDQLRALTQKVLSKRSERYIDYLSGIIELKDRHYPKAIGYLEKAVALLPHQYMFYNEHAPFMDSLARPYLESGDLEKAREGYEKITALTIGSFYYGDIYAKAFYKLGLIYERQGQKTKAKENYQKFLVLWKYADSGLPEVGDAKKKLAALK